MNYYSYKNCIDACFQCAAICYYCANADLKEDSGMANCAGINMECATICTATAQMLCLGSGSAREIARICLAICEKCADECARHKEEHCRECVKACQACAIECSKL